MTSLFGLRVPGCAALVPVKAESPFACTRCYLLQRDVLASRQRALPLLHSSDGLMRQTKSLPLTSVIPISEGLCRLSPVPAERWSFPALSPQSLRRCLDPYPAVFSWCTCSFLPRRLRPHVRRQTFGTPLLPLQCNFNRDRDFGAAVIL